MLLTLTLASSIKHTTVQLLAVVFFCFWLSRLSSPKAVTSLLRDTQYRRPGIYYHVFTLILFCFKDISKVSQYITQSDGSMGCQCLISMPFIMEQEPP